MTTLPPFMVDVFIDFENVWMTKHIERPKLFKKIDWLTKRLGPALQKEGYKLGTVKIFARQRESMSVDLCHEIFEAFGKHGWDMVWSQTKADTAFKKWVRELLEKDELASTVMFVTSDADFADVMREVKDSGRTVFVAGKNISHRLLKPYLADRAFRL